LLNALGLGIVLILLFRTLFGVLRQYLVAHVGRKMDLALIVGYARHLLGLPLQFFEMRRGGEISCGSTTPPRWGRPSAR
jgi:ATP-binding cassette, subfamily C, bacteriocin exporter